MFACYRNCLILFSVIFFPIQICANSNQLHTRNKRFLVWKNGYSHIQVIWGFGVPLDLELETVIIGYVMKAFYQLPHNATDFIPGIYYERRKRALSRWDVYDFLGQAIQMRGFGDGKACVLQAICELSHTPLEKNNGLYEELLHLIFNPDSTDEELKHYTNKDYHIAQKLGRQSEQLCRYHYPGCNVNLVDMFTL